MNTLRSQEDIVARIAEIAGDDLFGFAREVLVDALDIDHARPFLIASATAEAWGDGHRDADQIHAAAVDYYNFALGKIENHRGLSADRSVDKLTQFAWLLGRDDVVTAMETAEYAQYGAPKVKAFGEGFGLPWPDDEAMVRMAQGKPCTDGCDEGCDR